MVPPDEFLLAEEAVIIGFMPVVEHIFYHERHAEFFVGEKGNSILEMLQASGRIPVTETKPTGFSGPLWHEFVAKTPYYGMYTRPLLKEPAPTAKQQTTAWVCEVCRELHAPCYAICRSCTKRAKKARVRKCLGEDGHVAQVGAIEVGYKDNQRCPSAHDYIKKLSGMRFVGG